MEVINVNGQDFEVLEIHKKKHESQDVFVCKSVKFGYKECFQRFDIYGLPIVKIRENLRHEKLTQEDIENIREEIKSGTPRMQLIERYKKYSPSQVLEAIKQARIDFDISYKQRYNGSKITRRIKQYDANMNLIADYKNPVEAGKILNIDPNRIRNCCSNPKYKFGGFYWRWADDE